MELKSELGELKLKKISYLIFEKVKDGLIEMLGLRDKFKMGIVWLSMKGKAKESKISDPF